MYNKTNTSLNSWDKKEITEACVFIQKFEDHNFTIQIMFTCFDMTLMSNGKNTVTIVIYVRNYSQHMYHTFMCVLLIVTLCDLTLTCTYYKHHTP